MTFFAVSYLLLLFNVSIIYCYFLNVFLLPKCVCSATISLQFPSGFLRYLFMTLQSSTQECGSWWTQGYKADRILWIGLLLLFELQTAPLSYIHTLHHELNLWGPQKMCVTEEGGGGFLFQLWEHHWWRKRNHSRIVIYSTSNNK